MKRSYSIPAIVVFLALFMTAGCKTREAASSNPAATSSAASANANSGDNSVQVAHAGDANSNATPKKEADSSADSKARAPAQLLGTYESREVQEHGVVTVISQLKTLFLFSADGTYFRESQVKGKAYHADSGTFRIEAPDKLQLTIQVTGLKANRKIQKPPLSKTHKFSLSPDGDELRLTSEKGSVGIFRRIGKPPVP